MTTRRSELLFCGGLVLLLVLLQSIGISRPFLRQHESNGTEFGKHARNHLKFGLGKTVGLMLDVSGPRLEAYDNYREHFYSNHPPLSSLLLCGAFVLFGVSETTFRAFLIVLSVIALLLFRRLASRLLSPPSDRIATAVFACLPMFVFYSIVTCLQVVALIGVLSAFLFYLRWLESGRAWNYAGIAASMLFACYSSWEGYYIAPALLVADFWRGGKVRGALLGLLGANLLIFGLYLLHLWSADPSHLTPVKSLLSAGASRSSLQGPPLIPYVVGEFRELALLFTLPVLGLAACWIVFLFRAPRAESDGLIAGAILLGLHELVFARLASQHEYYSYFLTVFAALATASGYSRLRSWIEPRSRGAALAASALLLVAFVGQASWILERRLSREGGYEFYHRLGVAIREVVPENERVFILTDNIPFYTPFYGDRASVWYDASTRTILTENTGPRRGDISEDGLLHLLRENPEHLDWAVTAEKGVTVPAIPWLQSLEDLQLEAFGVETRLTPRRELLEQRCGPPRIHGGFLFWKLN